MTNRSTAVSTIIVSMGNFVVMGFGLLTTILLMRFFDPDEYGLLTTMLALMSVLPVFMDFGTTPSMLRFGPFLQAKGLLNQKSEVLRSVFYLRLWAGAFLLALGAALAVPISTYFLHTPDQSVLVMIALIGSAGSSFLQFVCNVLQVEEKFLSMTVFKSAEALIKLAALCILFFLCKSMSPSIGVMIFAAAPFLVLIFSLRSLPLGFLRGVLDLNLLKMIAKFSFWYMVSSICLMSFMNFDIFILAFLKPAEEVGFFGSGNKLASVLYIIVNALNTVFMPRVGSKTDRTGLIRFLNKTILASGLIALFCTPFIFAGPWMIHWIAGDKYINALAVFRIAAWDHIVMIAFTPLMVALLAINRPSLVALIAAAQMMLNIIGDLIFVPAYGAAGAAAVTLSTRMLVGVCASLYLAYRFKTDPNYVQTVL